MPRVMQMARKLQVDTSWHYRRVLFSTVLTKETPFIKELKKKLDWETNMSVVRKKYAAEEARRKSDDSKRRSEEAAKIKSQKAALLGEKLARSVLKAKKIQLARSVAEVALVTKRNFNDNVRKSREGDADKRRASMIFYLEKQSKSWLSPSRVDIEINSDFLTIPGLAGSCEERSPYWGYVADVDDLDSEDDVLLVKESDRSHSEAISVATDLYSEYTDCYREYKALREEAHELEEFLSLVQETPMTTEEEYEKELEQEEQGNRAPFSWTSSSIGTENVPSSRSNLRPEDQDKQKVEEQLARLRTRWTRPSVDSSNQSK
jgi:hypothetical protein